MKFHMGGDFFERLPIILAGGILGVIAWSRIAPYDMGVWYVEIASVLVVFAGLAITYKRFRFSNVAYLIVSMWLIMHSIGAKYSFELVPFDTITNLFGFERNHYDRVAHFVIGMNSFGVAEYVFRKGFVNSARVAAFFGIIFIMALANAWELIEWAYAELDGGEVGAAFLGSQGDIWDAQKDMLCDTLGAIFASMIFPLCVRVGFVKNKI